MRKRPDEHSINTDRKEYCQSVSSLVKCGCPLLLNMFWLSLLQDDFFYDKLVFIFCPLWWCKK